MHYQQLIDRHEALQKLYETDVDSLRPSQVQNYLNQLRAAGTQIEPNTQRDRLIQIAHMWDDFMRANNAQHRTTHLDPYNSQKQVTPPKNQSGTSNPLTALLNDTSAMVLLGLAVGAVIISALLWTAFAPNNGTVGETAVSPTVPFTPAAVAVTIIATPTEPPPPTVVVTPLPTAISYQIRSGDALITIAEQFGTTVDALREANGLINDNIFEGETLIIPVTPTPLPNAAVVEEQPSGTGEEQPIFTLPTPADGPRLTVQTVDGSPIELRIAPGTDEDVITSILSGEVLLIVFRTPRNDWYSVQLNDGYTRGWLPASQVSLGETAVPAAIPTFVPSP